MARLVNHFEVDLGTDPAFWESFGLRSAQNMSKIMGAFRLVENTSWSIPATSETTDLFAPCKDQYPYGGIGYID
jgi:hypothetical protein